MSRERLLMVWPFFIFTLLMMLFAGALHFWPASWWFEVRGIQIDSGRESRALPMIVDRTIHRPFNASWTATVREWDGGGWIVRCTATGAGDYMPDARFPKPLTLQWWTRGQCHPLPAGKYTLTTTWAIQSPGLIPDKTAAIVSNVFEVVP